MLKRRRKSRRFLILMIVGVMLALLGCIPVRMMLAYQATPTPQANFLLGGVFERTQVAARFWQLHPTMEVWVSDFPRYLSKQEKILEGSGVPKTMLHLNGQATDTVTNFTTLVHEFVDAKLQHLFYYLGNVHDYSLSRWSCLHTMH